MSLAVLRTRALVFLLVGAVACGQAPDADAANARDASARLREAELTRQLLVSTKEIASLQRALNEVGSAIRDLSGTPITVGQASPCGDDVDCSFGREAQLRDQVQKVLQSLRATQEMLRVARRSAASKPADSILVARTRQLESVVDSLSLLAQQKVNELELAHALVRELTYDSTTSAALVEQLEGRLTALAAADDSVYFIAAPKDVLLKMGVVQQRGGTLISFGFGKTLVPMASPPSKAWRVLSKSDSTVIVLPRSDRWYEVLSAHPMGLLKADQEKGNFRQGTLRILSPADFWKSSRFLVLRER